MRWILLKSVAISAYVSVAGLSGCSVDPAKDQRSIDRVLRDGTPPATLPSNGTLSLRQVLVLANHQIESLSIEGELLVRSAVQKRRAVSAFCQRLA